MLRWCGVGYLVFHAVRRNTAHSIKHTHASHMYGHTGLDGWPAGWSATLFGHILVERVLAAPHIE